MASRFDSMKKELEQQQQLSGDESGKALWNLDVYTTDKYTRTTTRMKAKELFRKKRIFQNASRKQRRDPAFMNNVRIQLTLLKLYNNGVLMQKKRYPRTRWVFYMLCRYVALEYENLGPNPDPSKCEPEKLITFLENFLSKYFDVDAEIRYKVFIVHIVVTTYNTYKIPEWYMELLTGIVLKGTVIENQLDALYSGDEEYLYVGNFWFNADLKYFMEVDEYGTDDEKSDSSDGEADSNAGSRSQQQRKKNNTIKPSMNQGDDEDDCVIIIKDEQDTSEYDSPREFDNGSPLIRNGRTARQKQAQARNGTVRKTKRNGGNNSIHSSSSRKKNSSVIVIDDDEEECVGKTLDSDVEVIDCDGGFFPKSSQKTTKKKKKKKVKQSLKWSDKPICVDDEDEVVVENKSQSYGLNNNDDFVRKMHEITNPQANDKLILHGESDEIEANYLPSFRNDFVCNRKQEFYPDRNSTDACNFNKGNRHKFKCNSKEERNLSLFSVNCMGASEAAIPGFSQSSQQINSNQTNSETRDSSALANSTLDLQEFNSECDNLSKQPGISSNNSGVEEANSITTEKEPLLSEIIPGRVCLKRFSAISIRPEKNLFDSESTDCSELDTAAKLQDKQSLEVTTADGSDRSSEGVGGHEVSPLNRSTSSSELTTEANLVCKGKLSSEINSKETKQNLSSKIKTVINPECNIPSEAATLLPVTYHPLTTPKDIPLNKPNFPSELSMEGANLVGEGKHSLELIPKDIPLYRGNLSSDITTVDTDKLSSGLIQKIIPFNVDNASSELITTKASVCEEKSSRETEIRVNIKNGRDLSSDFATIHKDKSRSMDKQKFSSESTHLVSSETMPIVNPQNSDTLENNSKVKFFVANDPLRTTLETLTLSRQKFDTPKDGLENLLSGERSENSLNTKIDSDGKNILSGKERVSSAINTIETTRGLSILKVPIQTPADDLKSSSRNTSELNSVQQLVTELVPQIAPELKGTQFLTNLSPQITQELKSTQFSTESSPQITPELNGSTQLVENLSSRTTSELNDTQLSIKLGSRTTSASKDTRLNTSPDIKLVETPSIVFDSERQSTCIEELIPVVSEEAQITSARESSNEKIIEEKVSFAQEPSNENAVSNNEPHAGEGDSTSTLKVDKKQAGISEGINLHGTNHQCGVSEEEEGSVRESSNENKVSNAGEVLPNDGLTSTFKIKISRQTSSESFNASEEQGGNLNSVDKNLQGFDSGTAGAFEKSDTVKVSIPNLDEYTSEQEVATGLEVSIPVLNRDVEKVDAVQGSPEEKSINNQEESICILKVSSFHTEKLNAEEETPPAVSIPNLKISIPDQNVVNSPIPEAPIPNQKVPTPDMRASVPKQEAFTPDTEEFIQNQVVFTPAPEKSASNWETPACNLEVLADTEKSIPNTILQPSTDDIKARNKASECKTKIANSHGASNKSGNDSVGDSLPESFNSEVMKGAELKPGLVNQVNTEEMIGGADQTVLEESDQVGENLLKSLDELTNSEFHTRNIGNDVCSSGALKQSEEEGCSEIEISRLAKTQEDESRLKSFREEEKEPRSELLNGDSVEATLTEPKPIQINFERLDFNENPESDISPVMENSDVGTNEKLTGAEGAGCKFLTKVVVHVKAKTTSAAGIEEEFAIKEKKSGNYSSGSTLEQSGLEGRRYENGNLEASRDFHGIKRVQEINQAAGDFQKSNHAGGDSHEIKQEVSANFQDTDQAGADFQETNEASVNFQETNQCGVDFQKTDQAGEDFLETNQVGGVNFHETGLDSPQNNQVCVETNRSPIRGACVASMSTQETQSDLNMNLEDGKLASIVDAKLAKDLKMKDETPAEEEGGENSAGDEHRKNDHLKTSGNQIMEAISTVNRTTAENQVLNVVEGRGNLNVDEKQIGDLNIAGEQVLVLTVAENEDGNIPEVQLGKQVGELIISEERTTSIFEKSIDGNESSINELGKTNEGDSVLPISSSIEDIVRNENELPKHPYFTDGMRNFEKARYLSIDCETNSCGGLKEGIQGRPIEIPEIQERFADVQEEEKSRFSEMITEGEDLKKSENFQEIKEERNQERPADFEESTEGESKEKFQEVKKVENQNLQGIIAGVDQEILANFQGVQDVKNQETLKDFQEVANYQEIKKGRVAEKSVHFRKITEEMNQGKCYEIEEREAQQDLRDYQDIKERENQENIREIGGGESVERLTHLKEITGCRESQICLAKEIKEGEAQPIKGEDQESPANFQGIKKGRVLNFQEITGEEDRGSPVNVDEIKEGVAQLNPMSLQEATEGVNQESQVRCHEIGATLAHFQEIPDQENFHEIKEVETSSTHFQEIPEGLNQENIRGVKEDEAGQIMGDFQVIKDWENQVTPGIKLSGVAEIAEGEDQADFHEIRKGEAQQDLRDYQEIKGGETQEIKPTPAHFQEISERSNEDNFEEIKGAKAVETSTHFQEIAEGVDQGDLHEIKEITECENQPAQFQTGYEESNFEVCVYNEVCVESTQSYLQPPNCAEEAEHFEVINEVCINTTEVVVGKDGVGVNEEIINQDCENINIPVINHENFNASTQDCVNFPMHENIETRNQECAHIPIITQNIGLSHEDVNVTNENRFNAVQENEGITLSYTYNEGVNYNDESAREVLEHNMGIISVAVEKIIQENKTRESSISAATPKRRGRKKKSESVEEVQRKPITRSRSKLEKDGDDAQNPVVMRETRSRRGRKKIASDLNCDETIQPKKERNFNPEAATIPPDLNTEVKKLETCKKGGKQLKLGVSVNEGKKAGRRNARVDLRGYFDTAEPQFETVDAKSAGRKGKAGKMNKGSKHVKATNQKFVDVEGADADAGGFEGNGRSDTVSCSILKEDEPQQKEPGENFKKTKTRRTNTDEQEKPTSLQRDGANAWNFRRTPSKKDSPENYTNKKGAVNKNLKMIESMDSNDDSSDSCEGKLVISDEAPPIVSPRKKIVSREEVKVLIKTKKMCEMEIQAEPVPTLDEFVKQKTTCKDVSKLLDNVRESTYYNSLTYEEDYKFETGDSPQRNVRTKAQLKSYNKLSGNNEEENIGYSNCESLQQALTDVKTFITTIDKKEEINSDDRPMCISQSENLRYDANPRFGSNLNLLPSTFDTEYPVLGEPEALDYSQPRKSEISFVSDLNISGGFRNDDAKLEGLKNDDAKFEGFRNDEAKSDGSRNDRKSEGVGNKDSKSKGFGNNDSKCEGFQNDTNFISHQKLCDDSKKHSMVSNKEVSHLLIEDVSGNQINFDKKIADPDKNASKMEEGIDPLKLGLQKPPENIPYNLQNSDPRSFSNNNPENVPQNSDAFRNSQKITDPINSSPYSISNLLKIDERNRRSNVGFSAPVQKGELPEKCREVPEKNCGLAKKECEVPDKRNGKSNTPNIEFPKPAQEIHGVAEAFVEPEKDCPVILKAGGEVDRNMGAQKEVFEKNFEVPQRDCLVIDVNASTSLHHVFNGENPEESNTDSERLKTEPFSPEKKPKVILLENVLISPKCRERKESRDSARTGSMVSPGLEENGEESNALLEQEKAIGEITEFLTKIRTVEVCPSRGFISEGSHPLNLTETISKGQQSLEMPQIGLNEEQPLDSHQEQPLELLQMSAKHKCSESPRIILQEKQSFDSPEMSSKEELTRTTLKQRSLVLPRTDFGQQDSSAVTYQNKINGNIPSIESKPASTPLEHQGSALRTATDASSNKQESRNDSQVERKTEGNPQTIRKKIKRIEEVYDAESLDHIEKVNDGTKLREYLEEVFCVGSEEKDVPERALDFEGNESGYQASVESLDLSETSELSEEVAVKNAEGKSLGVDEREKTEVRVLRNDEEETTSFVGKENRESLERRKASSREDSEKNAGEMKSTVVDESQPNLKEETASAKKVQGVKKSFGKPFSKHDLNKSSSTFVKESKDLSESQKSDGKLSESSETKTDGKNARDLKTVNPESSRPVAEINGVETSIGVTNLKTTDNQSKVKPEATTGNSSRIEELSKKSVTKPILESTEGDAKKRAKNDGEKTAKKDAANESEQEIAAKVKTKRSTRVKSTGSKEKRGEALVKKDQRGRARSSSKDETRIKEVPSRDEAKTKEVSSSYKDETKSKEVRSKDETKSKEVSSRNESKVKEASSKDETKTKEVSSKKEALSKDQTKFKNETKSSKTTRQVSSKDETKTKEIPSKDETKIKEVSLRDETKTSKESKMNEIETEAERRSESKTRTEERLGKLKEIEGATTKERMLKTCVDVRKEKKSRSSSKETPEIVSKAEIKSRRASEETLLEETDVKKEKNAKRKKEKERRSSTEGKKNAYSAKPEDFSLPGEKKKNKDHKKLASSSGSGDADSNVNSQKQIDSSIAERVNSLGAQEMNSLSTPEVNSLNDQKVDSHNVKKNNSSNAQEIKNVNPSNVSKSSRRKSVLKTRDYEEFFMDENCDRQSEDQSRNDSKEQKSLSRQLLEKDEKNVSFKLDQETSHSKQKDNSKEGKSRSRNTQNKKEPSGEDANATKSGKTKDAPEKQGRRSSSSRSKVESVLALEDVQSGGKQSGEGLIDKEPSLGDLNVEPTSSGLNVKSASGDINDGLNVKTTSVGLRDKPLKPTSDGSSVRKELNFKDLKENLGAKIAASIRKDSKTKDKQLESKNVEGFIKEGKIKSIGKESEIKEGPILSKEDTARREVKRKEALMKELKEDKIKLAGKESGKKETLIDEHKEDRIKLASKSERNEPKEDSIIETKINESEKKSRKSKKPEDLEKPDSSKKEGNKMEKPAMIAGKCKRGNSKDVAEETGSEPKNAKKEQDVTVKRASRSSIQQADTREIQPPKKRRTSRYVEDERSKILPSSGQGEESKNQEGESKILENIKQSSSSEDCNKIVESRIVKEIKQSTSNAVENLEASGFKHDEEAYDVKVVKVSKDCEFEKSKFGQLGRAVDSSKLGNNHCDVEIARFGQEEASISEVFTLERKDNPGVEKVEPTKTNCTSLKKVEPILVGLNVETISNSTDSIVKHTSDGFNAESIPAGLNVGSTSESIMNLGDPKVMESPRETDKEMMQSETIEARGRLQETVEVWEKHQAKNETTEAQGELKSSSSIEKSVGVKRKNVDEEDEESESLRRKVFGAEKLKRNVIGNENPNFSSSCGSKEKLLEPSNLEYQSLASSNEANVGKNAENTILTSSEIEEPTQDENVFVGIEERIHRAAVKEIPPSTPSDEQNQTTSSTTSQNMTGAVKESSSSGISEQNPTKTSTTKNVNDVEDYKETEGVFTTMIVKKLSDACESPHPAIKSHMAVSSKTDETEGSVWLIVKDEQKHSFIGKKLKIVKAPCDVEGNLRKSQATVEATTLSGGVTETRNGGNQLVDGSRLESEEVDVSQMESEAVKDQFVGNFQSESKTGDSQLESESVKDQFFANSRLESGGITDDSQPKSENPNQSQQEAVIAPVSVESKKVKILQNEVLSVSSICNKEGSVKNSNLSTKEKQQRRGKSKLIGEIIDALQEHNKQKTTEVPRTKYGIMNEKKLLKKANKSNKVIVEGFSEKPAGGEIEMSNSEDLKNPAECFEDETSRKEIKSKDLVILAGSRDELMPEVVDIPVSTVQLVGGVKVVDAPILGEEEEEVEKTAESECFVISDDCTPSEVLSTVPLNVPSSLSAETINAGKMEGETLYVDDRPLCEMVREKGSYEVVNATSDNRTPIGGPCLPELSINKEHKLSSSREGLEDDSPVDDTAIFNFTTQVCNDNCPVDNSGEFQFAEQDCPLNFFIDSSINDLAQDACLIDPDATESMFIPSICKEEKIDQEEEVVSYYVSSGNVTINDNDKIIREDFSQSPMSIETMNMYFNNSLSTTDNLEEEERMDMTLIEVQSKPGSHTFPWANIGRKQPDAALESVTWTQESVIAEKDPFNAKTINNMFLQSNDEPEKNLADLKERKKNEKIMGEVNLVNIQKLRSYNKDSSQNYYEENPFEGSSSFGGRDETQPTEIGLDLAGYHRAHLDREARWSRRNDRKRTISQMASEVEQNGNVKRSKAGGKVEEDLFDTVKKLDPNTLPLINSTSAPGNIRDQATAAAKDRFANYQARKQPPPHEIPLLNLREISQHKKPKPNIIDPEELSKSFEREIKKKPLDKRALAPLEEQEPPFQRNRSSARNHPPDVHTHQKPPPQTVTSDKYETTVGSGSRGHASNRRSNNSHPYRREAESEHGMSTRSSHQYNRFTSYGDPCAQTGARPRHYNDYMENAGSNRVHSSSVPYGGPQHSRHGYSNSANPSRMRDRNKREVYTDPYYNRKDSKFPLSNFRIGNPRFQHDTSWLQPVDKMLSKPKVTFVHDNRN